MFLYKSSRRTCRPTCVRVHPGYLYKYIVKVLVYVHILSTTVLVQVGYKEKDKDNASVNSIKDINSVSI